MCHRVCVPQRPSDRAADQGDPGAEGRAGVIPAGGDELAGTTDNQSQSSTEAVSSITVFLSVCVCDQSGRLCQALRGRVNELEAELAEQSHLRLQAAGESEFLKAELEDLRRVREDTEKEQRSLTEIESTTALLLLLLRLFCFHSVTSVNSDGNAKIWGKHGTSREVFTL